VLENTDHTQTTQDQSTEFSVDARCIESFGALGHVRCGKSSKLLPRIRSSWGRLPLPQLAEVGKPGNRLPLLTNSSKITVGHGKWTLQSPSKR
ncbi:unnamed protein product, partial [Ectocarpus fasciculatus]